MIKNVIDTIDIDNILNEAIQLGYIVKNFEINDKIIFRIHINYSKHLSNPL